MNAALVALALALAQQPEPRPVDRPGTSLDRPAPAPEPAAEPPQAAPALAVPAEAPPSLAERSRRYQIERIELHGLAHTQAAAVLRHVFVVEGDVFDPERVKLSRLRLLQLGWFSRVDTRVEKGSTRGLVVVVFTLVERNTIVVTDLVIGSTPAQRVYGGLGLLQQNFLGRGLGLGGAFVYGGAPVGRPQDPDRLALRASFFAPDLAVAGQRLVVGTTVWFLRGQEFACGDPDCASYTGNLGQAPRLVYQRAGGEMSFGFRSGAFDRFIFTYHFDRVDGRDIPGGVPGLEPGGAPPLLPGWSTVSALAITYEVDTRDDFFFPTEGMRALASITFGSALLGSDYEYTRYFLQLESPFALLGWPLRFQAALGAAQGGAPFFERFYAADFSYFAIGPALGRALELNFSTDPRYDAFLAAAGLEYAVPLFGGSGFFKRGYLALGLRGVYSTETLGGPATHLSRSPVSADVALRLDTPVGAFNLSVGYFLDIVL